MEGFGPPRFGAFPSTARKKRSQACHRPRADSQLFPERWDHSSSSLTPLSDDVSKISSDETADTNSKIQEFSLNQNMPRTVRNERSREGVLAPANWKSTSKGKEFRDSESRSANEYNGRYGEGKASQQSGALLDALENENKVQKVKLKVGGITRTIHAKPASNGESSVKSSRSSDSSKSQQKQNFQGNLEEEHFVPEKQTRLQGFPRKDFSKGGFIFGKEENPMGKAAGKNTSEKLGDKPEPIRKSNRTSKRRVLRGESDEDEEDDEIRYLMKLKSKTSGGRREEDEESSAKLRNLSTIGTPKAVTNEKKSRSEPGLEDTDYEDEEEPLSDSLAEDNNKKRQQKKESLDSLKNGKREMALTTRQQALQSSKEGSSAPGANRIEFPDGLPPPTSRKQKEQLTEVEQQLKKAEAAQRRRIQVEKAARESEAEAIRKILGQESSRKKREEKNKKRQEELAQERAANALTPPPDTIRVVTGPTGTVMTFPAETGIPKILDQKPISYPPPREKCAGPSCTNTYKYRDSKSKLPLCSLKCYKAVQGQNQVEPSGAEPNKAEPEPIRAEPTIAEIGRAERSRVEPNCWRYQVL